MQRQIQFRFLITGMIMLLFSQSLLAQEWFKGELYFPMPLPKYQKSEQIKQASIPVHFDMKTRQEFISTDTTVQDQRMWMPGVVPSRSEISTIEQKIISREFSNLSRVADFNSYPQRTNVKVFIRRGSQNFVCSGIMIDPSHVLTAAHCIHDGTDWADEVTVVPAFNEGDMPYGEASSVRLMSWIGWIGSRNFDHDMGVISLDNPIGLKTGWLGYGFNPSDNFFQNQIFHNFSYPAAAPFDGQTMQYRRGEFDNITTFRLLHNDEGWGGQSGSGVYFNNDGNRIVYGVHCHSNNDPRVGHTRITGQKFNDIRAEIRNNTPANSDLIPLAISRISDLQVTGKPLTDNVRFSLFNHSRRDFNRNVRVEVYISKNKSISRSDVLIGTVTARVAANANGWTTVDLDRQSIVLPKSLEEGTYFLGIRLNESDANTSNNTSTTEHVIKLDIEPGPFCRNRSSLVSDSGIIVDGSENEYYANRSNCRWLIKPQSGGKFIRLIFDSFEVAPGDTLYVYNGESSSAPLLGSFSGTRIPRGLMATKGAMYIQFRSNTNGRAEGWSAEYQVLHGNPDSNSPCLGPFPNPADKEFYLLCSLEEGEVLSLELYDNTGRPLNIPAKIDEHGPYVMDVSDLASGIYYLRIKGEGYHRTEKIIIQ